MTVTKEQAQEYVSQFRPWVVLAAKYKAELPPGYTLYIKHNSWSRTWTLAARYFDADSDNPDDAKWKLIMNLSGRAQAQEIYDAGVCQDWNRCLS